MIAIILKKTNIRTFIRNLKHELPISQLCGPLSVAGGKKVLHSCDHRRNFSDAVHLQNQTSVGNVLEQCDLSILTPYSDVLKTDEEKFKAYNALTYYYKAKDEGKKVPSSLCMDNLKELLLRENKSQQRKFLEYLYKKEMMKLNSIAKKEKKKLEKHLEIEKRDSKDLYGIGKNTILLRVLSNSINRYHNKRLAYAILFGQKIVIDLDYEEYMNRKEVTIAAQQLAFLYTSNQNNRYPFDLYICNVDPSSGTFESIRKRFPYMCKESSFMSVTQSSYTDIFPKQDLVYLSPHAETPLKEFDPTAIYIIGGFVDTTKKYHISNEKAYKEGIKCYSLPLNEHVMWGIGSRSLSINQVFDIMLEMKISNDWKKAFANAIPKRKIQMFDPEFVKETVLPDKLYIIGTPRDRQLQQEE